MASAGLDCLVRGLGRNRIPSFCHRRDIISNSFSRPCERGAAWFVRTARPKILTAEWIARQITKAFPWDQAPRYILRNRDESYGAIVRRRLRAIGIRDHPIAPGSPWQNGHVERLIGTIRRECLDHIVVMGEAPLRRALRAYTRYYNEVRTHRSLDKDTPDARPIQITGTVCSRPVLGGLHHHYVRI